MHYAVGHLIPESVVLSLCGKVCKQNLVAGSKPGSRRSRVGQTLGRSGKEGHNPLSPPSLTRLLPPPATFHRHRI